METVFVDLDGTLARNDTYLPFLFHCAKVFGVRIGPMSLLPLFFLLYSVRVVPNARLKEVALQSVLSGVPVERLEPVVEEYVAIVVQSRLNQALVRIVHSHLTRGDRVILVTASFDLYVERLAERIGISEVVCTHAEMRDGILTGRIFGRNCHGHEKVVRLEALVPPTAWETSILYTDHHSDLPLLKKVSKGFLVNPGARTRFLLKHYEFSLFPQN